MSSRITHPLESFTVASWENEWKRQIIFLYYCEHCFDLADSPRVPGPHFEHWFTATFWGVNDIAVSINPHPTPWEEKVVCFLSSRLGISLNVHWGHVSVLGSKADETLPAEHSQSLNKCFEFFHIKNSL